MVNYNYYVIHCIDNKERYKNIKNMEGLLGINIEIFPAIIGKNIDIKKINTFDENLIYTFIPALPGSLGCYLSHFTLLKQFLA